MQRAVRFAVLCLAGALATGCSVAADHPETGGVDGVATSSIAASNGSSSAEAATSDANEKDNACDLANAWIARSNFAFDADDVSAFAANVNPLLNSSDRPAMTIS